MIRVGELMFIRQAKEHDLFGILRIMNNEIKNGVAIFDLEEKTEEEISEWYNQLTETYPILVAEENGELAGYACLGPFNKKKAYQQTAELSVYVNDTYQGLGIGKALMETILNQAVTYNFHSVMSLITVGNGGSVYLHEKFGFKKVGVMTEVGYKFNEWHDVIIYQWFNK